MPKHFKLQRFYTYLKYDLTLNGKKYIYFGVGLFLSLIIVDLYFICVKREMEEFNNGEYSAVFSLTYIIASILMIGSGFPFLRDKKKISHYFLLPSSIFEKFLVEFFIRVVCFTFFFLFIFWIDFKIAYKVYWLINYDYHITIETFGIFDIFKFLRTKLDVIVMLFSLFSLTTFLFAGATYFKKYTVIKIIISFALLIGTAYMFSVLLSAILLPNELKELGIKIYGRKINDRLNNIQVWVYCIGALSSLFLLPFAYFKLKEKEV
jgi:hypothetical protein